MSEKNNLSLSLSLYIYVCVCVCVCVCVLYTSLKKTEATERQNITPKNENTVIKIHANCPETDQVSPRG